MSALYRDYFDYTTQIWTEPC